MRLCSVALANSSSKQADMVPGCLGGCGEETACSWHPTGLGHLSVGLVLPDSSGRGLLLRHGARVSAGRGELLPLWHESKSASGKEGRENWIKAAQKLA